MFDRNRALKNWRDVLSANGRLTAEEIGELEAHVLDTMEELSPELLTEEERFAIATLRLGHPVELSLEYEKARPWTTWQVPIFWATIGVAWVLGAEAIFELAVPLGIIAAESLNLSIAWLNTWAFVVYVGGPLIAFGSVAAWMNRYPAGHPASGKALFIAAVIAVLIRGASVPLNAKYFQPAAWSIVKARSWWPFYGALEIAALLGFFVVACVGAAALVRFREQRTRTIHSI